MTPPARLPFACLIALGACFAPTCLAPTCFAKDPPGKDRKVDEPPRPTDDELKEIRELMGKVTRGRHPSIRANAAGSLGNFGPKAHVAVPALVTALKDRDVTVSSAAASALGKVGLHSKDAVRALVDALDRDPALATCAAEALGRIGANAAPALPALLKAAGSEDVDLRREATYALGRVGSVAADRVMATVRQRLADDDHRVQLAAALSLTRLNDDQVEPVIDVLVRAVPRDSRTVIEMRQEACEALGTHGPRAARAVQALIGVLRERPDVNPALPYADQRLAQHHALRRAAATALGAIGDREALPALRSAAEVPELAEAAEAAIARIESASGE